jgi:hypothetical protein
MNADASRGVGLDARLGTKVDWLLPVLIAIAALGFLLLAGGAVLVVVGSRGEASAAGPLPAPLTVWPPPPLTGGALAAPSLERAIGGCALPARPHR